MSLKAEYFLNVHDWLREMLKLRERSRWGVGPSFSFGPGPHLARSPISVWLVRVIVFNVSVKLLMHLHLGSTCSTGESI